MKFSLGQTVVTSGVNQKLSLIDISHALNRHINGDWGDLSDDDKKLNDEALKTGEDRIFSAYHSSENEKFWIITEWDHSVTTVLFPSEY